MIEIKSLNFSIDSWLGSGMEKTIKTVILNGNFIPGSWFDEIRLTAPSSNPNSEFSIYR